jgi:hypothetical protein
LILVVVRWATHVVRMAKHEKLIHNFCGVANCEVVTQDGASQCVVRKFLPARTFFNCMLPYSVISVSSLRINSLSWGLLVQCLLVSGCAPLKCRGGAEHHSELEVT